MNQKEAYKLTLEKTEQPKRHSHIKTHSFIIYINNVHNTRISHMVKHIRTPVLSKGPSELCCMKAPQHLAAEADQCLLITKGPKRWSIQLTRSRERKREREGERCSRR